MQFPKNRIMIMLFLTAVFLIFAPLKNAAAENSLSFSEIMPNPEGTDTKTNEYFKLKNYSEEIQSIDNYKVCNISNECYLLKGEIGTKSCLKILRSDFIFTLHNDKEELTLYDQENNLLDKITIGTAPSGKAWLCSEIYCEWGESREICDYSDIIDPATEPTDNDDMGLKNEPLLQNENDNIDEDKDTEAAVENKNSNANTNKGVETFFEIVSKKDWKKVEKEMDRKNLLSTPVNIQGKIIIPLNIVKSNSFYILASGKFIQISIYTSRQNDFKDLTLLYQKGTQIKIEGGYLKNNQQTWQVGVAKKTNLKIIKNKNNVKNNEKYQNNIVSIAGEILKKSGQYFFIMNKKNNSQPVTIYIPTVVWVKFLKKENIGVFPQLVNNKVVTATQYKGKILQVSGVKEMSGSTYRILVASENEIIIVNKNERSEERKKREAEMVTKSSSTENSVNKSEPPQTK